MGELASGYWYGDESRSRRGVRVLTAMRDYRAAETAMRKRMRSTMNVNETDLVAIRIVLQAHELGRTVSPKDLSTRLGISSASTTILVDRLERSGHVVRRPHPTDRRGVLIEPTPATDTEVRATMSAMHERMIEVAETLEPPQAEAVVAFLAAMRRAVELRDDASPAL